MPPEQDNIPPTVVAADPPLVSVVIPTRNRPDYLRLAVESVLAQDYRPIEIVISDDSTDARTSRWADGVRPTLPADVALVYRRNVPPLGQAGNINALFDAATGPRLLLLHDDDLLMPGAIATLVAALDAGPRAVAAYGLQRVCDDDGTDLGDAAAEALNRRYGRTPREFGPQPRPLVAGILRQFPNDGYLVDAGLARQVRYRTDADIGNGCESDFGVRLGRAAPANGFVLVPRHTCVYRKTATSMSAGGSNSAARFYSALAAMDLPREVEWARRRTLAELAPTAIHHLAANGDRSGALRLWLARSHRRRWLTTRGLVALLRIAFPSSARRRRPARPAITPAPAT